MTLGERIKKLRLESGLTQEELAKEIGYSTKTSISKIENDVLDINQSTIVALARALKTTPSVLMGWTETENKPPLKLPSGNEQELLTIYRNVNQDGQDYIMQTARMVEGTERYRKYETVRAASRSVTDKPIEDIKVEKSKIRAALSDDSIKDDSDL
mgnify:CR=1 FL=1